MFEAAELGHTLSQRDYEAALPKLRAELLSAHFDLRTQPFPVIVIVSGADGAGKGDLVHRLNEWLDPRGVETHAFWDESDEERERPPHWRFWRALPGRGRVGIFFGSWYTSPIIRRVYGKIGQGRFRAELDRIVALEKMLTDDGALILKLWLHLPKREQKKRLQKLERDGRIGPDDWKHFKRFGEFTQTSEHALRHTDTGPAPWHVIEATDRRHREFTAGSLLLGALRARLKPARTSARKKPAPEMPARLPKQESILDHVDLRQRLSAADYTRKMEELQNRLGPMAWAAREKGRSMVMVFEGWDAAGKGSAIRRVTDAMEPRLYRVVGIAAPTDEERAHHYLWRFWRHLPRAGATTIFDRSWYGRLLVERVEKFAPVADWQRAYHEINEFEEQLVEHGIVLCKFWLHISADEQLRRFKERARIAYKRYKITDEDWRNRAKWPAYQEAVDDMIAHCSTDVAPWTVVAGNDKRFARVQILKTVVKRLEAAL